MGKYAMLSVTALVTCLVLIQRVPASAEGVEFYWIEISGDTNSTTSFTSGWWRAGSQLSVTGYPSAGLDFSYWSGDVPGGFAVGNPLVITVDRAARILGHSAIDTDQDGLPDAWELLYGGLYYHPYADTDADGAMDLEEYDRGTDPFDSNNRPPFRFYVDWRAPVGGWGDSWENALNDLQEVLYNAAPGDEIWVAEGVYLLDTNRWRDGAFEVSGAAVYGGFAGTEADLHERNWQDHPTVLLGAFGTSVASGLPSINPVIRLHGDSVLDGFVIANGVARSRFFDVSVAAAAVVHDGSRLRLRHCVFSGNSAQDTRRAAAVVASGSTNVSLESCAFVGNSTLPVGNGALLRLDGSSNVVVSVDNCTIVDNAFGDVVYGGALSERRIRNCVVWDNSGTATGATYSCVDGGSPGAGSIQLAPQFNDAFEGQWAADAVYDQDRHTTTLDAGPVNWQPGEWMGRFVKVNTNVDWVATIISNDTQSLTVAGPVWDEAGPVWSVGLTGVTYRIFDPRLQAVSPCIDTGITENRMLSETDLQGEPRVVDQGVDMGAYEFTARIGLDVRVYLAGAFNTNTMKMTSTLRLDTLLNRTPPYALDRRMLNSIPSGAVDLVLLLVTPTNAIKPLVSRSVFLLDSGRLTDDEGGWPLRVSLPTDRGYDITLYHRNHAAVQTLHPVFLTNQIVTVDFTFGPQVVQGGSAALAPITATKWGMIPGDADGDGRITHVDWLIVSNSIGNTGYLQADLNLDGDVTEEDTAIPKVQPTGR